MRIHLTHRSVDGVFDRRSYKTLEKARVFAHHCVGESPDVYRHSPYATSFDGIGTIHKTGCDWVDLFPKMDNSAY